MRKIFILGIIFFVSVFIFYTSSPGTEQGWVVIQNIRGDVVYLLSGRKVWKTARDGIKLYSGDSIKTGKSSYADILFKGKKQNIISIKPLSYIVVKLDETEKIELINGKLFSIVQSLQRGSVFEIKTPTAVCGARGTGWTINADRSMAKVRVFEGDVYVKGIDKLGRLMEEVKISAGYEALIRRFEKASRIGKVSDREIRRWREWKRGVVERKRTFIPKPREEKIKEKAAISVVTARPGILKRRILERAKVEKDRFSGVTKKIKKEEKAIKRFKTVEKKEKLSRRMEAVKKAERLSRRSEVKMRKQEKFEKIREKIIKRRGKIIERYEDERLSMRRSEKREEERKTRQRDEKTAGKTISRDND